MNIQFILSDTTNGATSGALNEVLNRAEKDVFSDVLVLVPETKSIAIERELLDKSKNNAFSNIYVYSFVRLLSRIGGINEEQLVSKQTAVMILRNIILQNFDRLTCYKKTAKTIGFAEKIYETIQQFKSSSYSLQDLKNLAENSEGALKAKMRDIALLFELFEEELAQGFFDDCDRLRKLGELAKSNEFIKKADVFVLGFDNVTSDMIEVLKQFAINAKSVTFSCVYFNENRKDKYIQDNELYKKFKGIAESLKFPYVPRFVKSSHCGDFWNIQNYIYSTERKQVESKGNVHVFELDNKSKEIDCLANLILSEVKNGKRFKDLAVIDANFDKDLEEISKVFDAYNIPYFISKAYDVSDHFLLRFIKNCFEVFASRFSADKVLKWLSNPILNISCYEEFESLVKAQGINYSGFFDKLVGDEFDQETKDKVNSVVELICDFKGKFAGQISGEHKVSDFVGLVGSILEYFDAEENVLRLAKFEKDNGLDIQSEISLSLCEKVKKIHNNLSKFLGDRLVSSQEFLDIYLSGFGEEEINLLPVSVDCVNIQKNADGLYNIKDLFILGAVDGSFPSKMADTGMLVDLELESLSNISNKKLEPSIKDLNKREKFLCYELMLLPSDKLFVLYSRHSYSSLNKPANVVTRLVKLFNLEIKNDCKINKFITQKIAEKQFAEEIGEYLSGEDLSLAELNREYNKLKKHFSSSFADYLSSLCFGEKEFKIQEAKEIYFAGNKTSVSQLERYFSCPYSFFARYGLRLKDNKDAKLSSLDIGTIIHKFAELFTKQIKSFIGLTEDEFDIKAGKVFEKSINDLKINSNKNKALIKFISDESLRLAHYLFDEQERSSFKNDSKLNEFEFWGNNAVKIELEDKVISIEGKIDRIDKFGDYIRIIDYKTGDTDSNLNSIYYGKKIQLVSYLAAAEKLGNGKIAGLFYLPIHSDFVKIQQKMKNNYKMQGFLLDNIDVVKYMDSSLSLDNPESDLVPLKIKSNKETRETGELQISYGRTKNILTEAEFEGIKNYTNELCKKAIEEILDGNIEPSPFAKASEKESSECKYCELAGFCGKEHAKFGLARRCGGNVREMSFDRNEGD